MKCNIIGAGRLGMNLAYSLSKSNLVSIESICNTSFSSSVRSCQKLGVGTPVQSIKDLPEAKITWVVCNDDSISSVVSALSENQQLKSGSYVIHCSGVLSSSVLEPLRNQGCLIGSFHPPKAFQAEILDDKAFNQVLGVIEGDDEVRQWLNSTFNQLGARLLTIEPNEKPIYHAAAVVASNYLVTLAYYSQQLLLEAGIEENDSKSMVVQLMQSSLSNLQQKQLVKEALTGPLVRGDLHTISKHLHCINNNEIQKLYRTMSMATLPMTTLSDGQKESIINALSSVVYEK
ncbi:Rossmann-like and DUF2520 domain-containing protein [Legionella waltersii]|uniref:Rossmann-like domain protein n=1 Tax=Legionella waltersii TaxID=66969 RepID=A0A0W1A5G9_9GAMM|nr:Rossmann-like and DUF2520 domain-containing protein [Legionella waltersii]KTD76464.1 Rossmann-like domain protein [Legionella waltersii]SNV14593.1 Uncharacterized conserved protein [Legionella waltersii]